MSEYVTIKVMLLHETEKAAQYKQGDYTFWVPLSLVEESSLEVGQIGEVSIPEWKAEEEGLEYDA